MAVVLGILGTDSGHHPAAALLVDGRLIAFAEEERFTRHKGGIVPFPTRATSWALAEASLAAADVDRVAYGWDCERYRWEMPLRFGWHHLKYRGQRKPPPTALNTARGDGWVRGFTWLAQHRPGWVRHRIEQGLRDAGLSGAVPPVSFHAHHRCHAASAAWGSGRTRTAVLVADGSGENISTSAWAAQGLELTKLWDHALPDSLGWFYSAFTEYLGFMPNRHEGKLMGLAAYGRPRDEFVAAMAEILPIDGDGFRFEPSFSKYGHRSWGEHFSDRVVERFGQPRSDDAPFEAAHHDLAWAVQDRLEQALSALARRTVRDADCDALAVVGGIAMNCKANGVLDALPEVDELFVPPAADDAGAALGAAMLAAVQLGDDPRTDAYPVATGPAVTADDAERALRSAQLQAHTPANLPDRVAELIAEGAVVGWVQGRMECGARALGRRSILASPTTAASRDRVNAQVKFREAWRPFAPSMTGSKAATLLGHRRPRPHMLVADTLPESQAHALAGVTHVDGSVRAQVVDRDEQPEYHALLRALGRRTGHEAVLNTSFNLRGEPIVCSAPDALRTFYSSGMDALVLGPWLLEKRAK